MSIEKGLVTILAGIGQAYPQLPQPVVYPVIRYQLISTARETTIDGENAGATEVGMQIDCMSDSYSGAKALAALVREVLHLYRGTWDTLTAHLVKLQAENDFNEQDGDKTIFWVSQRYQIWTDMD